MSATLKEHWAKLGAIGRHSSIFYHHGGEGIRAQYSEWRDEGQEVVAGDSSQYDVCGPYH
jgi:hypothetical protein